jgi:hypothetical protein
MPNVPIGLAAPLSWLKNELPPPSPDRLACALVA